MASAVAVNLKILTIAVLGKHGNPLFLQSYTSVASGKGQEGYEIDQDDLKWHYACHTSLDFFEEREAPNSVIKSTECYLGLLYVMEDYAVYGYQSNTRVKFVLILALTDSLVRDVDVKTIFRGIHNAYISYVSNPFTNAEMSSQSALASPIRSKKFRTTMLAIAGVNFPAPTISQPQVPPIASSIPSTVPPIAASAIPSA